MADNKDDLDEALLACISRRGEASVPQMTKEVQRAYTTVLLRCLKLETQGLLCSSWRHGSRIFSPGGALNANLA